MPATGLCSISLIVRSTITYYYDNAGNKNEVQTPSATTYYGYDPDNRLSAGRCQVNLSPERMFAAG
jgi:hypothetical protein